MNYTIESEEILKEIIQYISTASSVDKISLTKDIFDFISVFVNIKDFLSDILKK